eukprot:CCRYP_017067-RA/>CCRYP_017067-RA protein AED:0.60 eAED:0.30 QI:0/0/0/0.5/0/0.5/2/0/565
MELLRAKAGRMTAYGITINDSQLALVLLANIDVVTGHDWGRDWGREFCPTLQTIHRKYTYNHAHDATTVAAILKELAGADGVRKLNNAPAPTGTANAVSNPVSLLTQLLQQQHGASDTDNTKCASAVQSNSNSSVNHRHNNNRQRTVGGTTMNATTNVAANAAASGETNAATCAIHPTLAHTAKELARHKPHPKMPEDRCFWNKRYEGYCRKWICDKMKMAYVPRHKFAADNGGYPSKSDGCGPETNGNAMTDGWITIHNKGQLRKFNSISNDKSSFYNSVSNYYSTLLQYAADPPHTSPPSIQPQFTLAPKRPPPIPIPSTFKHKTQRKVLERQTGRLHLLNEATLLDRHISWAEDERTSHAKADTNSKQRRAIDTAHTTYPGKTQLSIAQHSRCTNYELSSTIRRAMHNFSTNRHVRFTSKTQVRHYEPQATTPLITFDSGADGHYLSETDRLTAGLPILRPSSRQVGVANGGTSKAPYVSRLPFPQLSINAALADSFDDFPQSLMSIGKTCDNGTVAIFPQTGVTVHKDTEILITCRGEPLLIGARDEHGCYRILLAQHKGH